MAVCWQRWRQAEGQGRGTYGGVEVGHKGGRLRVVGRCSRLRLVVHVLLRWHLQAGWHLWVALRLRLRRLALALALLSSYGR